ncbi:hypothetical protein Tco_0938291 [Tanacetum coccineum]|uniref:Uncharacterized protein n=1 Tax=Tanacetum coccineum TaxID=301880 RepID=A0ABQ5DGR8_9ASTR
MSCLPPTHIDSETISQIDGARSSRVPIPLPDDPYMAVRQAYLATITDFESEPFEDSRETEIPQPLFIASSPVIPLDDPYLIVRQAHTPATIDTESEPEEAPSKTEEFQPLAARTTPLSLDHTPTSSDLTPVSSLTDEEFEAYEPADTRTTSSHSTASSDSTTLLSPNHPLIQTSPTPTRVSYYHGTTRMAVRTQPTLSTGMSARIAESSDFSPSSFCKRYRSFYETPSPSSSPTLPIRKRYRGTSKLVEDTEDESSNSNTEKEGSEDEGPGSEEEKEEAAPEGLQQAILVVDTATDEPLGLGYRALRRRELALRKGSVPSIFEIGQSSRSVSEQQRVEETPAPRPPTPLSPEWSSDSLPVSPSSLAVPTSVASPADSSLVASPATVEAKTFLTELGAHVELQGGLIHDHTQHLDALPLALLRSLEQEQERATMTFDAIWRPMLALESWAGHVET